MSSFKKFGRPRCATEGYLVGPGGVHISEAKDAYLKSKSINTRVGVDADGYTW